MDNRSADFIRTVRDGGRPRILDLLSRPDDLPKALEELTGTRALASIISLNGRIVIFSNTIELPPVSKIMEPDDSHPQP